MISPSWGFRRLVAGFIVCLGSVAPAAADVLYVSATSSIQTVDAAGVPKPLVTSGLSGPEGVAFDAAGNLFVQDHAAGKIFEVLPGGTLSTFASGISGRALAFDSAGTLYATSDTDGSIRKIAPDGTVSVFVAKGFAGAGGLAFDSKGNLYVGTQAYVISKITPGGVITNWTETSSFFTGLAVDRADNLYAASFNNNRILKITPDGTASDFVDSGLSSPIGLTFDSAGNLYAVNGGSNSTISKIAPDGTVGQFASGLHGLQYLTAEVPEPSTGCLLVAAVWVSLARRRARKTA